MLLLGYGGAASVMAYHCVTQGAYLTITGRNPREGRGTAEAADRCRSGRTHFRIQPPAHFRAIFISCSIPRRWVCTRRKNAAPLHYLPHKTEYVFDAIYNPPVTSTMKLANPRKTKTRDGLFMLVMQAAHAQNHLDRRDLRAAGVQNHSAPYLRQNGGQASAREAWQKKIWCCAALWAAARPPSAVSWRV